MNESLLNKLIWLAAIIVIVVMSKNFYAQLVRQGGTLTVITDGLPSDTVKLRWEGPIRLPMQQRIYEAWQKWGGERNRIILSLNSRGGQVSYGGKVIALLRNIRKTNLLETQVGSGDVCMSMCVPIYLQGKVRTASNQSRWMFHKVKFYDALEDKPLAGGGDRDAIDKASKKIVDRYFRTANLNENWLRDMEIRYQDKDYFSTGYQLMKEKSGIIHQVF